MIFKDLEGKSAIILGGGGSVGRPILEAFLNAGIFVYMISRRASKIKIGSDNCKFIDIDMNDEKSIDLFFKKDFSIKPSIFVNAAYFRDSNKNSDYSLSAWKEAVSINSSAAYLWYSKVTNFFIVNNIRGNLINISSIYGYINAHPKLYENLNMNTEPHYPFVKAGLSALNRYFSVNFGKNKIRYNIIILGGVLNNQPKEFIDRYCKKVPLNRMAKPKDLMGLCLFLASDAAGYITGAEIPLDGGLLISR